MNYQDEIQDVLNQMGVDETIGDHTEVNIDQENTGVETETIRLTVFQPIKPGEKTQNIKRQALLKDGRQIVLDLKKRPRCPSCRYVPSEEGEPAHLAGACSNCDTQTCPRCKNRCNSCGTILCNHCTSGHGVMDEVYCSTCLVDIEDQIEFDRRTELLGMKHDHQMEMKELERKIAEKKVELQQQQHDKEFEKRLKAEKFKLEVIKERNKQRNPERREKDAKEKLVERLQERAERIQNHPAYQQKKNKEDQ